MSDDKLTMAVDLVRALLVECAMLTKEVTPVMKKADEFLAENGWTYIDWSQK